MSRNKLSARPAVPCSATGAGVASDGHRSGIGVIGYLLRSSSSLVWGGLLVGIAIAMLLLSPGVAEAQTFSFKWGSPGSGDGQFSRPLGVAVDSSGKVYVADRFNNRIQKFDSTGGFIGWAGKCTSGVNCDTTNNRSIGFTCTDATCSGLSSGGNIGGGNVGQFNFSSDVAVDSSGDVYVVDTGNHRIQKFDSSGAFLTEFNTFDTFTFDIFSPLSIAVDSLNNVYVSYTFLAFAIGKFDSGGNFLGCLSSGISGFQFFGRF